MSDNKQNSKKQDGALIPVNTDIAVQNEGSIDEAALFERIASIIESRKSRAASYANSEITLMFWEVGRHINSAILDFK